MLPNQHLPRLPSMNFPGPPLRPEASSSSAANESPSRTLLRTASSHRSSISINDSPNILHDPSDTKPDPYANPSDAGVKRQRTRTRYTRSTRGCFTCRSAKVKCDETLPTCLRCQMNRRECEWPDPEQLAHPRKSRKKNNHGVHKIDNNGDRDSVASTPQPQSRAGSVSIPGFRKSSTSISMTGTATPTSIPKPTPLRVPLSQSRDLDLAAEKGWREIPIPALGNRIGTNVDNEDDGERDRSVSFSMEGDLFPIAPFTNNPAPSDSLFSSGIGIGIPSSSRLSTQSNPNFLSNSNSNPIVTSTNMPITPVDLTLPRINTSSSSSYEYQPRQQQADPLPTPSLSNSVLANRRMTKGKHPAVSEAVGGEGVAGGGDRGYGCGCGYGQSQGQGYGYGDEISDGFLHGISIESLINALDHDPPLIELGPVSHLSNPSAHLPNPAQALQSAFPSPLALQLFHHFANHASRILVTMGNNGPHKNPILTLCTPQRLLDTSSAAAAALRMSMLSTSIAHLENELTAREKRRRGCGCRCQTQGREGDPNGDLNLERNRLDNEDLHLDRERAAYLHVRDRLREVGKRFKTAALANIVLVEEDESDQFDTVLATCVIIMMRDVISASDWSENFEYAIRLVSKRGGPQAVLSSDPTNFTRRFLLENLTTHDIFSCFITQKEPVLMDRFDPWWYSCIETSSRSWEWESVERTFGISRGMVDFIARVVTLNAQKRRLRIDFTSPASDAGMYKVESFMRRQAESLLLELDVWHNGLSTLSQHVRVDCGDYIYKYMCCVYILGEILDQPVDTPRITSSIDYVLELCSEATALRQVVMLVWPLLICGSFCLDSVRGKVLSLLDAFEDDYCEDLRVAREIVLEQWKCMDEGLGRRSFGEVMMRIGKYVLLI